MEATLPAVCACNERICPYMDVPLLVMPHSLPSTSQELGWVEQESENYT